ncbi:ABC transporter ATP-binding protein [Enterococcus ratti]|uniref:ABC transporter ATP-binding protein n=1 Tax=Enterococcus ratti TaxID=150033 RepID=UPI0035111959
MKILEIRNLTKKYGEGSTAFEALKGVNLEIHQGEAVAIIGKSGSGKSTLMHILALLDHATTGEVILFDRQTSEITNKEQNILRNQTFGFVFQQFFLNSKDTVLNNVLLPLKIAGTSSKKRKELAMKALKSVELENKAFNKAMNLSGGQKQRVCIARALVNNPKVIFADEPTGNLDSATGEKIETLLFQLNKEKRITLIIVTHDPELAARCDRQIQISDGQIIKEEE